MSSQLITFCFLPILFAFGFFIISPIFFSPPVVVQAYEARVMDSFAVLGNDALVSCLLPSHAADLAEVFSWSAVDIDEEDEDGKEIGNPGSRGEKKYYLHFQMSAMFFLCPSLSITNAATFLALYAENDF